MATVIDALVMTLGLDSADFEKNRKRSSEGVEKFRKQANSAAKDVAHGGKVMAEGFSFLKTELLGLLAVFGAATGIKEFIATNVKGQAELGRLSRNLGVSARSLEAWGLVAQEMGGQATDAFGALQSVASGLAEASIRGHSALTDMARANGVILTDAKGKVLGYEDALISISKRLTQLPRQQARFLADQLGVGSVFNELMLGPQELRQRLDAAARISRVTDASTASAMRLQKQWADIQQRFKETSEIAFAKLSPVLERLAERFANWLDSVDWDKVSNEIERLVKGVDDIVKGFGGWKNVAIALGGVLALKVLSPILGIVGGLARMVPLLASVSGGMAALGVAGAGLAGWGAGKVVHRAIEGTKADNLIGWYVANIASLFGSKEATDALLTDMQHDRSVKMSRGRRNHNPGNLNFAGQRGAHLESGPNARFAAFGSDQEGIAALVAQLRLYVQRGNDTIAGIVKKYAPASDGNNISAYITALVRATGKNANDHLDLSDMNTLIPLVQGIVQHEGNGNISRDAILRGVRVGAGVRATAMQTHSRTSTSQSETHIGKVEVHTQATDAKGIARDIGHELRSNTLIAQADTGLD